MFAAFLKNSRWPAILLCLWMVSLTGIHSIPLEDHEVLVLQTTREMQAQGEWVLPSFNYEPRLKKPPFNYWATAAVSRLDPSSADVEVWHGRLVSLLGGLAMVLATYFAGKRLYGPMTGRLAALLLLASQGFANLSHNARPDFLYATFCVLQLFAWIYAWLAEDGSRRQWAYGWLGWAMAGLATLTKGPQVPVVFLAGFLVFLLAGPDRRRTLKVLRPFGGLALFCLLVLPWWLLLQQRLKGLQVDLAQTQLSGSLLKNLASGREIFSGYYLYTLFSLMLPVSLVTPFLLRRLWKDRGTASAPTRILLWASAVMLVVFTIGGHYRKHYLLPLLPVCSLFLAQAVRAHGYPALKGFWKVALLGLLAAIGLVELAAIVREGAFAALAWILLCSLPLGVLLRQEREHLLEEGPTFSAQLLKACLGLAILTTSYTTFLPSSMDRWRASAQGFAQAIGQTLQPGDLIIQWKSDSPVLPYFAKRPVPRFDERARLEAYFRENSPARTLYAVVPGEELPDLTRFFETTLLKEVRNTRHPDKDLVFVRLSGLKPS